MEQNKVTLQRVLIAPAEKIFRAFSDAGAMASWLPPYGFYCTIHHFDFKLGGIFKMSFTNFTTNGSNFFGGEYLEIIPNQLLRYSDRFDDPNLPGEIITTVQFNPVSCATEILISQTGIPDIIPAEMCYLGWQESLEKLKKLVEPNIPDA
jgi:uncharacterized protein YndB with AHSA1/START domain